MLRGVGGALVAVAAAAGCALPERDNPRDPINVPPEVVAVARIEIDGETAYQFSRIQEVTLTAADSGPSGRDLYVTWFGRPSVLGSSGEAGWTPLLGGEEHPIEETRTWTPTIIQTFVDAGGIGATGTASWELRALVRDDDSGKTDEAVVAFQVYNRAPEIRGDAYREFPPGGTWWAGLSLSDARAEAVLFVEARDPDRDGEVEEPVSVRWEQIAGEPIDTLEEDPPDPEKLTIRVPVTETTARFLVTASDGNGAVVEREVTVAVHDILLAIPDSATVRRLQDPGHSVPGPNAAGWAGIVGAVQPRVLPNTGQVIDHDIFSLEVADTAPITKSWTAAYRSITGGKAASLSIADGEPLALYGLERGADSGMWAAFRPYPDLTDGARIVRVDRSGLVLTQTTGAGPGVAYRVAFQNSLHTLAADPPTDGLWFLRGEPGAVDVEVVRLDAEGIEAEASTLPQFPDLAPRAIRSDGEGGAWILFSDDPSAGDVPGRLLHVDTTGAPIDAETILLPPEATGARTFDFFASQDPLGRRFAVEALEPLSFVVLAPDPLDPSQWTTSFAIAQGGIYDLAFDPLDGGVWAYLQGPGVARKFDAFGMFVTGAGGLDEIPFEGILSVDPSNGKVWVATRTPATFRAIPGVPPSPFVESGELGAPETLGFLPGRGEVVVSGNQDARVVALGPDGSFRRDWTAEDFGSPDPIRLAAVDPMRDTIWFTDGINFDTKSRLWRIVGDGTPVASTAALQGHIVSMEVDPGTGDLCAWVRDAVGGAVIQRIGADGSLEWSGGAPAGTIGTVKASPADGACFYLDTQVLGRVSADGSTQASYDVASLGFTDPISLTATPDGNAYFVDQGSDAVVRAIFAGTCLPGTCVVELAAMQQPYVHARMVTCDPLTGMLYVAVGPDQTDPNAPSALLRYSLSGDRVAVFDTPPLKHVFVNR